MSSLLGFTLPHVNHVTICERDGRMESVPELEETAGLALQGLEYPDVEITKDTFKHSISRETAKSVFIEHNETMTKRLLHAWYEHGVDGVFEELAQQQVAPRIAKCAGIVLSLVRWVNTLHTSLLPHHSMTRDEMIREFSVCRQRDTSPIRAFAWHPHREKLAVCLRDDSIRIYRNSRNDLIPVLKHKHQKMVSQLAWRPYSASQLAVACGSCVLVWTADPTSLSTRPSSSLAQVLTSPGHCPVVHIAWSPQSCKLVSASPSDTAIMVWDLSSHQATPLRRLGGGGVTLLAWSPDGARLLSATPASMFRVWQCRDWTCDRWTKLRGRCQAACWSPCGRVLLFATNADYTVFSVQFPQYSGDGCTPSGQIGSHVATACLSVEPCDLSRFGDHATSTCSRVGGYARSMCWDPTGQRLAIMFSDGDYVAVYRTRIEPITEILPCGLVSGRNGESPCLINFMPNFQHGALLTVVWSSGRVGYVPLWFMTSRDSRDVDQPISVQQSLPPRVATTLYSTSSAGV